MIWFLILDEHRQPLVLLDGLSVHEYRDLGEVLRLPIPVVLLLLCHVEHAVHLEGRLLEGHVCLSNVRGPVHQPEQASCMFFAVNEALARDDVSRSASEGHDLALFWVIARALRR